MGGPQAPWRDSPWDAAVSYSASISDKGSPQGKAGKLSALASFSKSDGWGSGLLPRATAGATNRFEGRCDLVLLGWSGADLRSVWGLKGSPRQYDAGSRRRL